MCEEGQPGARLVSSGRRRSQKAEEIAICLLQIVIARGLVAICLRRRRRGNQFRPRRDEMARLHMNRGPRLDWNCFPIIIGERGYIASLK